MTAVEVANKRGRRREHQRYTVGQNFNQRPALNILFDTVCASCASTLLLVHVNSSYTDVHGHNEVVMSCLSG